jgi:flagellar motor protein MotB
MTMTRPPTVDTAPEKPKTARRTWIVAFVTAVLALALGIFLGMRAVDATKSPEYRAQAEKLATTESDLAFAEAALGDARESQADAEDSATDAADKLATFQGQLAHRKEVLRKREDDLKKLRADLDDREARLDKKAENLAEREKDVKEAEELLAVTTVPGDGSFEVGADVEAGSYRSAGKRSCHYTVYGDAAGKDVLLDKTTAGSASVSLRAGTWFVTRGCAEWTRQ